MDRNLRQKYGGQIELVALRKESVDRNQKPDGKFAYNAAVALRKESVDRNSAEEQEALREEMSLSARRAWIEIIFRGAYRTWQCRRSPQGERG